MPCDFSQSSLRQLSLHNFFCKMANQAWQITSPGNLVLKDLGPPPSPGPKEILVRIHAFALNYRDILNVDHDSDYPLTPKENLIPGSDAAGIIEAAGPDSRWKQGDRVVVHPNTWQVIF
jgi:NADPH:quinone reductase-like Zn-dependent oxidoreductase